jgi:hypothetical protein
MGHHFGNRDLTWRGNDLCVGNSRTPLVSSVPDATWPNMWRVRHGDRLSDMANATRARDAARSIALAILSAGQHERRPGEPPLMRQNGEGDVPNAASHGLQVNKPVRPGGTRTRLAAVGQIERAKGGRGKRGGISEAARRAGISRFAAMRAAKRVRQRATKDTAA